jgi:hypothetical protein
MIIMDSSENNKDTKNYVEFVFYRVLSKNHELLLKVTTRLIELLKKGKYPMNALVLIVLKKYMDSLI